MPAWINVHDGKNAIGVWIDRRLTEDILYTGSYKSKGDWVRIEGKFNRTCAEHGGDLDIHAQSIRKLTPGREMNRRLDVNKRKFIFVLCGIILVIWILKLLKHK